MLISAMTPAATLSLLLLLLSSTGILASASVPAVVVASPGATKVSDLTAKVSARTLAESLHRSVGHGGILLVVTVDEGLALADFNGYGDNVEVANVAGLSQRLGGRHLLVTDAAQLLPALRALPWPVGGVVVDVADAAGVVQAATSAGSGAVRLVTARAVDLASADRLLGEACAALQARGLPFVAVFTASRVSRTGSAASAASGRHLLAEPAAPTPTTEPTAGTFVNCKSSVMLYYKTLLVRQLVDGVEKGRAEVAPVSDGSTIIDATLSKCDSTDGNRILALAYKQGALPSTLTSLSLTLNMTANSLGGSFWTVHSAVVSVVCRDSAAGNCTTVKNAQASAKSLAQFGSPNGTCYHCSSGMSIVAGGENATVALVFGKFQFQAFGLPAGAVGFSKHVNDCVGFFSVEVWFSLLVLVVVTVILMYGVLMLMSIATPDRFDDPKGKTIQVNVQEGGN